MSVISKTTRPNNAQPNARVPKEHDGIWLNMGIIVNKTKENPEGDFIRLQRGVAISDLETKPVYSSMSEEYQESLTLVNSIVTQLKARGLELEEGQAVSIGLEVQLYRKQEEETPVVNKTTDAAIKDVLFG